MIKGCIRRFHSSHTQFFQDGDNGDGIGGTDDGAKHESRRISPVVSCHESDANETSQEDTDSNRIKLCKLCLLFKIATARNVAQVRTSETFREKQ